MPRHLLGLSACLVLLGAASCSVAADTAASQDVAVLKSHGIATDGPGLAAFIRQRTRDRADETHIKTLIHELGADSFKVREKASKQLVTIGARARLFLQAALKSSDPEIARRAQTCLDHIGEGASSSVVSAAVRMLTREKPAEAVAVLLAYLPEAEEESVAETIRESLAALAVRDGKPEPVLVEALSDKSPIKRGAAAVALSRTRLPDTMPGIRKLLQDRDPNVRLRVGLALIALREKEAMPVLLRLLDELPAQGTEPIMILLERLAGDTMPAVGFGADAVAHRKYREAWETWWKDHQAKIAAERLEQETRTLGFTLIVLLDLNTIEYLDRANRVQWKIENVERPLDVQLLPGEQRVLTAEHQANRVCERNLKGEIVWKKLVQGPLAAQRLPDGHTFITMQDQLLEVDKEGKEVFSYSRPDGATFMRATKMRNGDIAAIIQVGGPGGVARFVRLTPSGKEFKEVKSWGVQVRTSGGRLDVLANGHVLIPEMDNNRVVEYDTDGKIVWEVTVDQPIAAVRLPNGNTIITLMRQNRAVEVDRIGKEVWQFKADTRVTRALRR